VHTDGKEVSDILWFGKPSTIAYEGRPYISNVYDCFTLARDFLFKEFNYDVGLHPRPADWANWNPHYISKTWASLDFTPVEDKLQYGDILFFAIASKTINHIGIYLGEDKFIHHLYERLSHLDYLPKWHKQFIKAIRYAGRTQI
jgi:cell wall-associated NlpC family hydrolase